MYLTTGKHNTVFTFIYILTKNIKLILIVLLRVLKKGLKINVQYSKSPITFSYIHVIIHRTR